MNYSLIDLQCKVRFHRRRMILHSSLVLLSIGSIGSLFLLGSFNDFRSFGELGWTYDILTGGLFLTVFYSGSIFYREKAKYLSYKRLMEKQEAQ